MKTHGKLDPGTRHSGCPSEEHTFKVGIIGHPPMCHLFTYIRPPTPTHSFSITKHEVLSCPWPALFSTQGRSTPRPRNSLRTIPGTYPGTCLHCRCPVYTRSSIPDLALPGGSGRVRAPDDGGYQQGPTSTSDAIS